MKVTGVITEYNPFHNGHKYHLEQARKMTDADYIVAVMSGDFTQRGTPAVMGKYDRARMALINGADLVLELPVSYACQSAEFFAKGSITLLDRLGVVNALCFGSECGTLEPLRQMAHVLAGESAAYAEALKQTLKEGNSYPIARKQALFTLDPALSRFSDILSSPNNILGIEYLKILLQRNSSIIPHTLKRNGSGYHEASLEYAFSSALAIRTALAANDTLEGLAGQLPQNVYEICTHKWHHSFPIQAQDFSALLQYKLLTEASLGFTKYMDVSEDLSSKIIKNLPFYAGYDAFCERLKSKDMTYTRISRCLMHILLNITTASMHSYRAEDSICYARILGFRSQAAPLLSEIKKQASLPVISKLADASKQLSPTGNAMLTQDILASHIYDAVTAHKYSGSMQNEYRRQIIITD